MLAAVAHLLPISSFPQTILHTRLDLRPLIAATALASKMASMGGLAGGEIEANENAGAFRVTPHLSPRAWTDYSVKAPSLDMVNNGTCMLGPLCGGRYLRFRSNKLLDAARPLISKP